MSNKLVDTYYNKLLFYRNKFFYLIGKVASLSSNNYPIRKTIEDIIKANNQYLLTDGLLYYLIITSVRSDKPFSQQLYRKLNNLSKDKERVINELFYYMDSYHNYMIKRFYGYNYPLSDKVIYLKGKETGIEHELNHLYDYDMTIIEQAFDLSGCDYKFTKIVLNAILCYALYKQDIDLYKELAKPFITNPQEKLDELKMNGVYRIITYDNSSERDLIYHLEQVISYVTNTSQSKNKLLIK